MVHCVVAEETVVPRLVGYFGGHPWDGRTTTARFPTYSVGLIVFLRCPCHIACAQVLSGMIVEAISDYMEENGWNGALECYRRLAEVMNDFVDIFNGEKLTIPLFRGC